MMDQTNNINEQPQIVKKPLITLKLIKKDQYSPLNSIQSYVYEQLTICKTAYIEPELLWKSYQYDPINSLIISQHNIDFIKFKELCEIAIGSYNNKCNYEKLTNDDLINQKLPALSLKLLKKIAK